MRKSIIVSAVVVIVAAVIGFVWFSGIDQDGRSQMKVGGMVAGLQAFNPDDLNAIIPEADGIFVGRVVEKLGTQKLPGLIETQFSVEVLSVLKGDENGVVTVSQYGGLVDGVWQIVDSDREIRGDAGDTRILDAYLLKPGQTYLFITIWNKIYGWYDLYSTPQARKDLGIDPSATAEEVRTISAKDEQVRKVKAILEDSRLK